MSEPDPSLISWDAITQSNEQLEQDDPIRSLLGGRAGSKEITEPRQKRGRGRPRKSMTPPVTEEFQEPVTVPEAPPMEIAKPVPPSAEELMSTRELASMFTRDPTASATKKKSSLRFSAEIQGDSQPNSNVPETLAEDPERATLLKMYKQYFKEPLLSKHKRREKVWTDTNLNSDIYRELKMLENAVSDDDPTAILGALWVGSLGAIEAFGPAMGLYTDKLTVVAMAATQDEKFKANMRELLLKYPYLRVMIGLGGYPELKLLITTLTLIKEVDSHNRQMAVSAQIPQELHTAFSNI